MRLKRRESTILFVFAASSFAADVPKESLIVFVQPAGSPRLKAHGAYKIDLNDFKIEGADVPSPEKNTILFDVNLRLRPAD